MLFHGRCNLRHFVNSYKFIRKSTKLIWELKLERERERERKRERETVRDR